MGLEDTVVSDDIKGSRIAEQIMQLDPNDPRYKAHFDNYRDVLKGPKGVKGDEWITAIKKVAAIDPKKFDIPSKEGFRQLADARKTAIWESGLVPQGEKINSKTYRSIVDTAKALKSVIYTVSQGTRVSNLTPGWSASAQMSRQRRNIG